MTEKSLPIAEALAAASGGKAELGTTSDVHGDKSKLTVHVIRVDNLIVHRFEKMDVLLRRADQIAQEHINAELRPGEYSQRVKPGIFRIYLPKLTPEAGQLRTAVIADNISREIRRINPGNVGLPEDADTLVEKREQARAELGLSGVRRAGSKSRDLSLPTNDEMRRQATGAVQLMLQGNYLTLEELVGGAFVDPACNPALSFEPIWQSGRHVVSAFRCALVETRGDSDSAGVGIHDLAGMADAQKDTLTLLWARPIIQSILEAGITCLLVIPVHFSILDSGAQRPAYLEALARIPEAHRQFFVLELIGVPADVSHYRLREMLRYLRGRCRSALCRIDLRTIDFDRFKDLGLFAVGAEMDSRLPDRQQLAIMEKFAAGAESRGLRTYLCGISKKPVLTAAIGSGFRLLSGPAVIGEVASPFGVQRTELDTFFRTDGYGVRQG
ncbi:MAG: hypothetical protein AB7E79_08650 [Rhodospirillaceae bacterium]